MKFCWILLLALFAMALASPSIGQPLLGEEYNQIGYADAAHDNRVADIADKLDSGALELEYRNHRGFFDSLLEAFDIDPSSQTLIFSPSSLQYQLIDHESPRAVYFNQDTYVAWVQDSEIVEIATMDAKHGLVFYTFDNARHAEQPLKKVTQSCLVCHDTYGMMGGGVPLLLARSSIYSFKGEKLQDITGQSNVTDSTPISERWGGWYVTGQHGKQIHMGNLILNDRSELPKVKQKIKRARLGNLDTLSELDFFNPEPYLRSTSDIVALLILEHQLTVQNDITYIKFKAPVVLGRADQTEALNSKTWDGMPSRAQQVLSRMLNQLVGSLLLVDAVQFESTISGNKDYSQWFESRGIVDQKGRSLRELDLSSQLFKYPLSYLIYSQDFKTLPAFAKDYIYLELARILTNKADTKQSQSYNHLSKKDRSSILQILSETDVEFARYLN